MVWPMLAFVRFLKWNSNLNFQARDRDGIRLIHCCMYSWKAKWKNVECSTGNIDKTTFKYCCRHIARWKSHVAFIVFGFTALRSFGENIKYLSVALWDLWYDCAFCERICCVRRIRYVIISKASSIYSSLRSQPSPHSPCCRPDVSNVSNVGSILKCCVKFSVHVCVWIGAGGCERCRHNEDE